jgi:hypothetical protein
MRVRLKGINKVNKRLSDGSHVTYYYAWKGGPRLPGQPGDQDFIAAYNAAVTTKTKAPEGILQSVLDAYQKSPKFTDLAVRTRKDYIKHIRLIETAFGDFPVEAIADRRARDTFLSWRDAMAIKSRRQADYAFPPLRPSWHGLPTGASSPAILANDPVSYIERTGPTLSGPKRTNRRLSPPPRPG